MIREGKVDWYENDERLFPGHFHAANLIELLLLKGFNSHQILKKTRLFYDDILTGKTRVTAQQFCQIIDNAKSLYPYPELSFHWGHGLFPGHYDSFSQLINHADSLHELLNIFSRYAQLTPLLNMRLWQDEKTVYLQWGDSIGSGKHVSFLVEAYTTAIVSVINWFYGEKLPWRFAFSESEPNYPEEFEVNLSNRIQFGLGVNLMMIDRTWLERPIPSVNRKPSSITAWSIAKKQCDEKLKRWNMGFIQRVLAYHSEALPESISLGDMAKKFNVSPATFKRKLARHQFNYQRIQDLARLNLSLQLIQQKSLKNIELAEYLEIKDVNNFRRAFKRWSGITPTTIKERLA